MRLRVILLFLLLAILSVSVGMQIVHAVSAAQESTISSEAYWQMVLETKDAISGLKGQPIATIRSQLDSLALRWQAVSRVSMPDGTLVPVDSGWLVARLRAPSPNLAALQSELFALLESRNAQKPGAAPGDLAQLKSILQSQEFQYQQDEPNALQKWVNEMWNRFMAWLNGNNLVQDDGSTSITVTAPSPSLAYLFATLFLVSVLGYIAINLLREMVSDAEITRESQISDEPLTSASALNRAQTLSTQGDYRSAVRYIYLSSLLLLEERGLLRYDRSKTNREYLKSVARLPQVAAPLRSVIEVFDRVWYGFENLDEAAYREYVAHVEKLKETRE